MDTASPRRRKTDLSWRERLPERFYRDVWMLVISGLLLWSLVSIQNQRWNNSYGNCQAANERYANTLRVLDQTISQAPRAQRAQARTQRTQSLAFIAALAPPHFDPQGRSTCRALADHQVNRWP